MKKTCCNCKKESIEIENNLSIGETMKSTNYNCVFNMDMKSFWMCQDCANLVDMMAREIIDMFGDEDITLGCILK